MLLRFSNYFVTVIFNLPRGAFHAARPAAQSSLKARLKLSFIGESR